MVDSQQVERLKKQVRALRGSVVRVHGPMTDRVAHLLVETRRLHQEAIGTDMENSLRSIENLLGCIERGLVDGIRPLGRSGRQAQHAA